MLFFEQMELITKTRIPFRPAISHFLMPAGRTVVAVDRHVRRQVRTLKNLLPMVPKQSITLQKLTGRITLHLHYNCTPKVAPQWGRMQCLTGVLKVDGSLDFAMQLQDINLTAVLIVTLFERFWFF